MSAHPEITAPKSAGSRGCARRWWTIPLGALLLLVARSLDLTDATPGAVLGTAAVALVFNAALRAALGTRMRRAVSPLSGAFDLVLVTFVVAVTGQPGTALLYLLAIGPYVPDWSARAGRLMAAGGAVLSVAGRYAHARWYEPLPGGTSLFDLDTMVFVDALLLYGVGVALFAAPARLVERLRAMRAAMEEAERGDLAVRASGRSADELGVLERSFNRMMDAIGATMSAVQHDADEVAAYSESLSRSTEQLEKQSASVGEATQELASRLRDQAAAAERGGETTGRTTAASQGQHAGAMADAARTLLAAAEAGREQISRAGDRLVAVGDDVRRTAAVIADLAPASERIGGLARSIEKVARQTRLLALNAAIEAARAGEHGRGFGIVAIEVRKLAEEAARAAKDVAGAISEVREGIAAAVESIQQGEMQVRDAGGVAAEANAALASVLSGIALLSELVDEAASSSERQSEAVSALLDALARARELAGKSASRALEAAAAATSQHEALDQIAITSRRLAEVAERLRGSASRFSVLGHRHDTAEYTAAKLG